MWNNPLNDPKVPLKKLKEKGMEWVDSLQVRPLERRDVRLSLTTQQYPKWSYSLCSLYATPSKLDSTMGKVYYRALPHLGYTADVSIECIEHYRPHTRAPTSGNGQ